MRLCVLVAAALCATPGPAFAGPGKDDAAELQRQGNELAKDGKYAQAIDRFKAADAASGTAESACLVALGYSRLEHWPQAELWLGHCRARTTPTTPAPPWVERLTQQVADALATANVAVVDITVRPPDVLAQVSVSTFGNDETFSARTIHLPFGHHVVTVSAPGYRVVELPIDVNGKIEQHITVDLEKLPPQVVQFPNTHPKDTAPAPGPSKLPKRLMILGGVTAGAGVVAYGLMSYAWLRIHSRNESIPTYNTYRPIYEDTRAAAIGLGAVGAGLFITGYILRRGGHSETPPVAVTPTAGGAVVVGWQR